MESTVEITLTIIALSFWILFPIGMFISVSHVDKNTDQVIRLQDHRHYIDEHYGEHYYEDEIESEYSDDFFPPPGRESGDHRPHV